MQVWRPIRYQVDSVIRKIACRLVHLLGQKRGGNKTHTRQQLVASTTDITIYQFSSLLANWKNNSRKKGKHFLAYKQHYFSFMMAPLSHPCHGSNDSNVPLSICTLALILLWLVTSRCIVIAIPSYWLAFVHSALTQCHCFETVSIL